MSNDEKHLLISIKKFENVFLKYENDKKALEYLLKQFVLPKSVHDRPLRKIEAIELMKYLNRTDLIDTIKNFKIPQFQINYKTICEIKIFDSDKQEMVTLEQYSKTKKIRISALLTDLKIKWVNSNFEMTNHDILSQINESYVQSFQNKKTKLING